MCTLDAYVYSIWRSVCLLVRHLIVGCGVEELSPGVLQPDADQRHQAVMLLNYCVRSNGSLLMQGF